MAFADALSSLLSSGAVLAVACAGLAAIVRLVALRDRLLGAAIVALAASFFVSLLKNASSSAGMSCGAGVGTTTAPGALSSGVTVVVVLGHVALAIIILRRRLGGVERARHRAAEVERARTRGRSRLLPDGEERQP
jgi:hypothetical protein